MPTYEYRCRKCGVVTDYNLPMKDRDSLIGKPCSACGEGELARTYSCNFRMMAPDQLGRVKPPEDWRNFIDGIKK